VWIRQRTREVYIQPNRFYALMDRFLSDPSTTIFCGLILSIAIFCAFKAGQVFERSTISERILECDLEKLKRFTEKKLEMLWKHYCDTNGNMQLPEGFSFKDIVEHFIIDENIRDQFLGLETIYLDLVCNGTGSSYFVSILDTYGLMVCS
jgi:hypothetical protein